MIKTFYCYDDTFNAFENAKNHVHKYLLGKGVITDIESYKVSNDHPAGYDCICVTVEHDDLDGINSFVGNTYECENNVGPSWIDGNLLLDIANHKTYHGCFYFDGDRKCGVTYHERGNSPKKRRSKSRK